MSLSRIEIVEGSIIDQYVDAIVNAANKSLLGGGGVDGVIHRAAGPQLLEECRSLGGCETGEAKITRGWDLKANFVIHTVGPVWRGGSSNEAELLSACYANSLKLAIDHGVKTIAFPAVSAGAFSYPLADAANIAIATVQEFLSEEPRIDKVMFCMIERKSYKAFSAALASTA